MYFKGKLFATQAYSSFGYSISPEIRRVQVLFPSQLSLSSNQFTISLTVNLSGFWTGRWWKVPTLTYISKKCINVYISRTALALKLFLALWLEKITKKHLVFSTLQSKGALVA